MIRPTLAAAAALLLIVPVHESHAQTVNFLAEWVAALKGERGDLMQTRATDMVWAAGQAYGWVNAELVDAGKRPLYCQPDHLALNMENYRQIVLTEYERNPKAFLGGAREQKVGAAVLVSQLLKGLRRTFPCS